MFCPGYKRKERYWVLCQETEQNVLLAWGRSAGLGCAGCGDEGAPRTHRLHCGHFRLLVLALCSPEPLTETPQGLVKVCCRCGMCSLSLSPGSPVQLLADIPGTNVGCSASWCCWKL